VASNSQPDLPAQLDGRRDIRGCTVTSNCTRTADLLRDFELEAFGPAAKGIDGPWAPDVQAPAMLQQPAATFYKKPSDIRPDLAWMDNLSMPDLPVRWTPRLIEYLLFYKEDKRGRNIMEGWLQAQGRYRDLLVSHLRKANLPLDLLYVSMIESSYDPLEENGGAGASGLWQFMPEGGKIYGLAQNRWVDERRDPLRSTIAVVDYWRDLYQRFGDWHVAMGAFNAGYGAMLKSIARFNTNDYWQLCEYENGLAWETTLYVPKALAVAIVGHNRAVFGFDKVKESPPETWQTVKLSSPTSLSSIASALGVKKTDIAALNPHLKRDRTPPGQRDYVIRVPVTTGNAETVARKIADMRSDWDGYDAYVVTSGERFEDIATIFGMTPRKLRELNEIAHESEVDGGTVLVVPKVSTEQRDKNRAKAKAAFYASGNDQKEGEPMIVAVPDKDLQVEGKRRVFYRVVIGDTQTGVARAFDVPRSKLIAWNGIDRDAKLHPKMIMQAFVDKNFDSDKAGVNLLDETQIVVVTRGSREHLDLSEQRVGRVRLEYTASGKESFSDVGRRFGLTDFDMARINRKSHKTVLNAGETAIVYQVVERSRSARAGKQWSHASRRGTSSRPVANGIAGKQGQAAIDSGTAEEGPVTSPGN
jgi:membrane-bound lytic murein transglycosylase D